MLLKKTSVILFLIESFKKYSILFKRLKQSTSKMNCPAFIKINAIRATQKLMVLEINDEHNHDITENDYRFYNKNRAIRHADSSTKNQLEDMIKSKANTRLVLKFLTEKTGRVEDLKAIHNYRMSLKLRGRNFSTKDQFSFFQSLIFKTYSILNSRA